MNEEQWNSIAEEYHNFIISPFQKDVENPLFQEILKIKNTKNLTIAEFGCGTMQTGKFLSENFKKVYGYDFSEKMVKLAKQKNNFKNLEIKQQDTTKFNKKNCFQVVLSVNSIIMPSWNSIKKCFQNIYNSMKKSGKFFLIVPSMESVIYEGMLILDQQTKKHSEKKAIKTTKKLSESKKYDYLLGLYKDGREIQKFYYIHEIEYLLKKQGFKNIKISKVKYPWKKEISDYQQFPGEQPLWDWFIVCEK